MNEKEKLIWDEILNFELDDPDSSFSFTDRLARENGWTIEFSVRSIMEYKRFIFLICVSDTPQTPSDQVDQVWHLHLIYTRSYWIDLCRNILKREIHHGPTSGSGDKQRFENQYEKTKALYSKVFEQEPPSDIWPSSKIRFSQLKFTRVNRHQNWVLTKPFFKK